MSGRNRQGDNDETRGVEAPGAIDRLLDRDRDDRADILEGGADRTTTRGARSQGEMVTNEEGEIRVPVVEERLAVGKREVELGEVEVRKTVETEEQTVPITLTHEEVIINEVRVDERPATGADLFEEATIRVRLRGEEAVVAKEAVVTGEVVINKEAMTEQQTITDTVRREHVDVERHFQEARSSFQQDFQTRAAGTGRTFEQAEPNYRAGFTAGHDLRYQGRQFEEIEPDLRREYETSASSTTGGTRSGSTGGDTWDRLRDEIRTGFHSARNRMS